jgi:hypothetical protein
MVEVYVQKCIEVRLRTLAQELTQTDAVGLLPRLAPSVKTVRVKPPTYDGKTPWSTYSKQFEAAGNANGWTEEDRATGLIVQGDALNILQAMPEHELRNYECLVGRLEMEYGDKNVDNKGRANDDQKTTAKSQGDSADDVNYDNVQMDISES